MTSARPRVLLVCHEAERSTLGKWSEDLYIRQALASHLALDEHTVDRRWPDSAAALGDLRKYEAVMWFTRFRDLRRQPPFDWGGYDGLRVMYDWDACQDFSRIASSTYLGQWPEVFRRHRFDVLVCTGRRTRDHLRAQGVDAEWIPKAADDVFRDLGLPRRGVCTFGAQYPARQVVVDHVRRAGLAIDWLQASPTELNVQLNKYLACVICNGELRMNPGLAKALARISGGRVQVLAEGPEPMRKNFEVAAAGAAPVCDDLEELSELGFVDGDTAVLYRSLPELTDKLRWLLTDPETLEKVGRNAAALARERHTWDARGAEFASLIEVRLR